MNSHGLTRNRLVRWYFALVPPAEEECQHGFGARVCPYCPPRSSARQAQRRLYSGPST